MTTDKNLKNRTILAYVHNMLIDAEQQRKDGKGTIVIDNDFKKEYALSKGLELTKYCEDNNCTVDSIEKLSFVNHNMLLRAKKYYTKIIDIYTKTFSNRHIPLLFAIVVFQKLEQQKYLTLDIDYEYIFNGICESDHLKKETKASKFRDKDVTVDIEVNIYNECVDEMFKKVYAIKPSMKRGKRK